MDNASINSLQGAASATPMALHDDITQTVSSPAQPAQDDSQTTVRHLTPESGPVPSFTPEFQNFFEGMFEEVLTAPETQNEKINETKEQEINEIHQELQTLEQAPIQQPVTTILEPLPTDPSIHGYTYATAHQASSNISGKTITKSLSWLTTLITKVFKSKEMKGDHQ